MRPESATVVNENARGAYNLIAPTATSNAEFMKILAGVLHRPYWFRVPAFPPRIFLGEMSVLLLEGGLPSSGGWSTRATDSSLRTRVKPSWIFIANSRRRKFQ
jgi:hypothetical protein